MRAAAATALGVRAATLGDLDTVVELRLALLRGAEGHPIYGRLRHDAPARARELFAPQLLSPHEAIFLAEREGRAIGIIRCVETRGSSLLEPSAYCYVSSVYVRPEARRQGVMRALVARAREWALARGLTEIRLHNIPETGAEHAWEALGFAVVEQVRRLAL